MTAQHVTEDDDLVLARGCLLYAVDVVVAVFVADVQDSSGPRALSQLALSAIWWHEWASEHKKMKLRAVHCTSGQMYRLYIFTDKNNMKFTASKFELLRYGKKKEITTTTTDKSYDDT